MITNEPVSEVLKEEGAIPPESTANVQTAPPPAKAGAIDFKHSMTPEMLTQDAALLDKGETNSLIYTTKANADAVHNSLKDKAQFEVIKKSDTGYLVRRLEEKGKPAGAIPAKETAAPRPDLGNVCRAELGRPGCRPTIAGRGT